LENEDYSRVIGHAKQAPYLNSLRRGGATLTNFYAEEHPSDANYLALAGGSAFGVPLTDPEEEIAAGDEFLKTELTTIMNSPATG
jgi:hypothetical protein